MKIAWIAASGAQSCRPGLLPARRLVAWPAACQAPGGLAGQAPVQDEFW